MLVKIKNRIKLFRKFLRRTRQKHYNKLSPEKCINHYYKKMFGVFPDLKNPQTFSEKLQWLKLNYRDEFMVFCADKYAVREYIRNNLNKVNLTLIYNVYDKAINIDYNDLPSQFVLKPNNSSGRVFICKDKNLINIKHIKKIAKRWERENLTKITGEWFYEKIPFKIILEEFLEDDITDYKLYYSYDNFIAAQVITERKNGFFMDYYDENGKHLNIIRPNHSNNPKQIQLPFEYSDMIEQGKVIAKNFPFSRIDFYYVNKKIYFGEVSFYPNNGFVKFAAKQMDDYFASSIKLPKQ